MTIVLGGAAAAYLVSEPAINRWRAGTTPPAAEQADDGSHQAQADALSHALAVNIPIDPAGDEQLLLAIARLEQRGSVTARIRQRASVGKLPFYGTGTYRQQGRGTRRHVRWLLQSQRDGVHATLLQVSDGRFLWVDRNLATGRDIERVDLWQLRRQASSTASATQPDEPESVGSAPFTPQLTTSYGGLPMLLESLRENFEFTAPRSFRLGDDPVVGMVGRWRPESLSAILTDTSQIEGSGLTAGVLRDQLAEYFATRRLPAHMPHHVLLLFGQEDLFPYLIDYRYSDDPLADSSLAPAELFQLSSQPLSRLEFFDVSFDQTIDSGEFIYEPPPEPEWLDGTSRYVQQMHNRSRVRRAKERDDRMATGGRAQSR